jgi:hypothetical protein
MATDNRGVMVYLPSEVEVKTTEYCTEYNITRKDKQGTSLTALGGFYRCIRSRSVAPVAIMATVHKLARIFYSLWTLAILQCKY